jgi:transposase
VQSKRVWARVLGVERDVVIEAVECDDEAHEVVVSYRLRRGATRRCGRCDRRCGRFDHGQGRRRWRALDAGTMRVFIEAEARRLSRQHLVAPVNTAPVARNARCVS